MPHPGRHVAEGERHLPTYVHHVYDGWEICTGEGIRCHCFTSWYDDCVLLKGGHATLTKRRPTGDVVYRFRWCPVTHAYAPDHQRAEACPSTV